MPLSIPHSLDFIRTELNIVLYYGIQGRIRMDLYISQEKAEDWYNYINKGQKLAIPGQQHF